MVEFHRQWMENDGTRYCLLLESAIYDILMSHVYHWLPLYMYLTCPDIYRTSSCRTTTLPRTGLAPLGNLEMWWTRRTRNASIITVLFWSTWGREKTRKSTLLRGEKIWDIAGFSCCGMPTEDQPSKWQSKSRRHSRWCSSRYAATLLHLELRFESTTMEVLGNASGVAQAECTLNGGLFDAIFRWVT